MPTDKFDDEIRFRSPSQLKRRLQKLAKGKRVKYQALVREVVFRFVEAEEAKPTA